MEHQKYNSDISEEMQLSPKYRSGPRLIPKDKNVSSHFQLNRNVFQGQYHKDLGKSGILIAKME